jgi:hypothetical protein
MIAAARWIIFSISDGGPYWLGCAPSMNSEFQRCVRGAFAGMTPFEERDLRNPRRAALRQATCSTGSIVKKARRKKKDRLPAQRLVTPCAKAPATWMTELAAVAAEARTDGGARLQMFLHNAKFDERPHLSLTKRAAA